MSYQIEGTIKVIEDTQTFSSGFSKREFVITTDDKYPQNIKFEATKEKVEMLDKSRVGDNISVSFNIRGNEWPEDSGKYYVNLQAWKIETLRAAQEGGPASTEDLEEDVLF